MSMAVRFQRSGWASAALAITACVWPAGAIGQAIDPLPTPATHVAILDQATGLLLHCKACETPMPPASMSKLMTTLIVAERIKAGSLRPDTTFTVSERAWRHGAQSDGSHMFLDLNSQVAVQDLMRGVIVVSANDACIVLAEGIAGSEEAFVDLMNRRAQELGLKSARFRNVTGLPDPDHQISAADLARLTRHVIAEHPDLYRVYSERSFTFNGKTQENRNPLLRGFNGADGVKTGHTSASGYGLIGSAEVNGARRIIVFNGLPSMATRASEAERLMRAAFFDFEARHVVSEGQKVGEAAVHLGSRPTVSLIAQAPVSIGAHRSVAAGLKAEVVYQGPLTAPIKKGDVVARLVIQGPGATPQTVPLVAGERVGRQNPFARAAAGLQILMSGGAE